MLSATYKGADSHRLYVQTNPYTALPGSATKVKPPINTFASRYVYRDEDHFLASMISGYIMEGIEFKNWLVMELPSSMTTGQEPGETRIWGYGESTTGERMILDPRLAPDDEVIKYYSPDTGKFYSTPPVGVLSWGIWFRGSVKWCKKAIEWISKNWKKVLKVVCIMTFVCVIGLVLFRLAIAFGMIPVDSVTQRTESDGSTTYDQHLITCQHTYTNTVHGTQSPNLADALGLPALSDIVVWGIVGGVILIVVGGLVVYAVTRPKVKEAITMGKELFIEKPIEAAKAVVGEGKKLFA